MSLGVKGGAVLYRRKQKARKMEDYSRYMEKLVNGSVIIPSGKEGEEMPWWTENHVVDNNGEKNNG